MEHAKRVAIKWAVAAQAAQREKKREEACHKDVRTGLFQKCPSADIHSGVTLQQTYYLLFCHFGFSTTNLGPDSISAPEMSASLTITRALSLPPSCSLSVSLTLAEWVCPLREKMVLFTALHPTLKKKKKTLSTRFRVDFPPLLKSSALPLIKNWPANRNTMFVECATVRRDSCPNGNSSGGMQSFSSQGFMVGSA